MGTTLPTLVHDLETIHLAAWLEFVRFKDDGILKDKLFMPPPLNIQNGHSPNYEIRINSGMRYSLGFEYRYTTSSNDQLQFTVPFDYGIDIYRDDVLDMLTDEGHHCFSYIANTTLIFDCLFRLYYYHLEYVEEYSNFIQSRISAETADDVSKVYDDHINTAFDIDASSPDPYDICKNGTRITAKIIQEYDELDEYTKRYLFSYIRASVTKARWPAVYATDPIWAAERLAAIDYLQKNAEPYNIKIV